MEGDTFSGLGNGTQIDNKVLQTFHSSFGQVQNILDQNRLLINEINHNLESRIPDNLSRNVGLIRELNNNIRRVVDLYADLSHSFTKSMEVSSEGDSSGAVRSDGKPGNKRNRAGALSYVSKSWTIGTHIQAYLNLRV
ncbi:ELF4-LIKE 4-like protein [Drosera capensis]